MQPLKIYLGDLTYDTVSLSTEAFPLNIGYVASYCKKRFGDKVEITLFKYIQDLDKAINESPPDILGLSNYAWCHRVSLEMFRMLLSIKPNAITVWGGPNFPQDMGLQKEFLNSFPEIDAYVPIEGEIGFSNVVEIMLKCNSEEEMKKEVKGTSIDGCVTRNHENELQYGNPSFRMNDLDEIPSPYLNGSLDKFFDGKLSPMLQTNRGCPFSCSFCVDGSDKVRKVNQFSLNRVVSEINYIAEHVPESTTSMFISDLNFGMIPRDLEVCDAIADVQNKYGYPKQIQATTGKNSKERIIYAIKRVNGALRIWMSVQSMDEQVLKNIRRDNISVDHMLELSPTIKGANLPTTSEAILGLPGDTYQSHLNTIRDLVKARVDDIQIYTLMMLHGAELNTPEQRKKWGLKTKFRTLPRDFAKLSNGKNVVEIEEVVISTDSLTFDEYVELRLLAFAIWLTSIGTVYEPVLKFLREKNCDVFELFYRSMKDIKKSSTEINKIFDSYRNATKKELWESAEDIEEFFKNDDNYEKLRNGEIGTNLIQTHHAMVMRDSIDDWTQHILDISSNLLKENNSMDKIVEEEFAEISNYCYGLSHNLFGKNRMQTNPSYQFKFNLRKWVNDPNETPLSNFKLSLPSKLEFRITEEQFKVVEDKIDIFGNSTIGMAQVIKRIPRKMLWRNPVELR